MRIPLNGLNYLIYNCFINQYTIKQSFNEILKFLDIMKMQNISQNLIIKIFRQLRQLIKVYYHKYLEHNPLGAEPGENCKCLIEINESKVIGNEQCVKWILGLIDLTGKQARIYYVMNYHTYDTLLKIVKKMIILVMIMKNMIIKHAFIAIISLII